MNSELENLIYQYNKYKYKYKRLKKQRQIQMHGGNRDYKSTTEKIILNAIYKFNAKFNKVDASISDEKYKQPFENMENKLDKIGFFNARLPPQSEQHTELPEEWKKHIIETKLCGDEGKDGKIHKLDIEIKNSAKQIGVYEILEKLHRGEIELNFAWSPSNNLVFVNFISKNPHDFTNTNYVFEPSKAYTKPYAFYKGECDSPIVETPFYLLLSRQFTTALTGSWIGLRPEEAFNKTYAEYDFSKMLPLRNMSKTT